MGRKPTRPLSFQERQEIEKQIALGILTSRIATAIERDKTTVRIEIQRHGGRDVYNAKKAHEDALARYNRTCIKRRHVLTDEEAEKIKEGLKLGYSKEKIKRVYGISDLLVRNYFKENGLVPANNSEYVVYESNLAGRVCALEAQVEILIEQIKEMARK